MPKKKFFGNISTLFKKANKNQDNSQQSQKSQQQSQKKSSGSQNKSSSSAKNSSSKNNSSQNSKQKNDSKQQHNKSQQQSSNNSNQNADKTIRDAKAQAREIIVEAKDEALALKSEAEREARKLRQKIEDQQDELNRKLDKVEQRLEDLDRKEARIDTKRKDLEELRTSLEESREEVIEQLEKTSSLTRDEAKQELFDNLEKKLSQQLAQRIRQRTEEAEAEADEKVQEVLINAMKHGATDYVPEYTISVVELPSEGVKGKIIGRNGRNIQVLERETGCDFDLDSSPTEVRVSCFDPVRREIGRVTLVRLIKDGRIQPSRIEETVAKVRKEIGKITFEAGKKLCHDVGVYNLPKDLMQLLGKFKYRFSYGQNLIAHTLEETKIGIKLAHEMGVDVQTVKLGCLLHDIGKVSEETEGSHVELGVKIAKKFDLPQPVIDCIAQHHEDEPFTGVEQMLVYIADAISGARPGARYENHEEYIERLEKLEEIASSYGPVKDAYAIQAGREVRVLLDPHQTKDDDVEVLAIKIRDRIKDEVTYPGTVTVNVIRENRGKAVAK